MRNHSFLILLLVGIASYGAAQQAVGQRIVQSVQLLPGPGNHHHPIATKNPEAQKFFIGNWNSPTGVTCQGEWIGEKPVLGRATTSKSVWNPLRQFP